MASIRTAITDVAVIRIGAELQKPAVRHATARKSRSQASNGLPLPPNSALGKQRLKTSHAVSQEDIRVRARARSPRGVYHPAGLNSVSSPSHGKASAPAVAAIHQQRQVPFRIMISPPMSSCYYAAFTFCMHDSACGLHHYAAMQYTMCKPTLSNMPPSGTANFWSSLSRASHPALCHRSTFKELACLSPSVGSLFC